MIYMKPGEAQAASHFSAGEMAVYVSKCFIVKEVGRKLHEKSTL